MLVGRRGAGNARAQQTIERLRRSGARVLTIAADVGEQSDVQRVMAEIAVAMPPLRGVFHAAAVLDDALVQLLTPRQMENAMRAKALGAWHLHRHTCDAPLDHFVLFSSVGSLLGNPGQAGYVAANIFLDALAQYRRSRNLPAVGINWGALAEVGMAADHPEVEQYLRSVGFGYFTPGQAMEILQQVLAWNPVGLCAAKMDWSLWGATHPAWIASARFRHLLSAKDQDRAAARDHGSVADAQQVSPDERKKMIGAILLESVAAVLRIAPEKLDHTQSLFNMGVDSMMAMELRGAIDKKVGVKISALERKQLRAVGSAGRPHGDREGGCRDRGDGRATDSRRDPPAACRWPARADLAYRTAALLQTSDWRRRKRSINCNPCRRPRYDDRRNVSLAS